jgi:glutamate N-acetyltransferase / amino-acid N-acetyltransferase
VPSSHDLPPKTDAPPSCVAGFSFGSSKAGLKKSGALDLGVIVADSDAVAAAVFTRNVVRAAPVTVSEQRIASGVARAILVNSGNANACTGKPGNEATLATTHYLADRLGVADSRVLPASTGVIGEVLPTEKINAAIGPLLDGLSTTGWPGFADAIRTTDRGPKVAHAKAGRATVLGIGKGAGMFGPDLVGPPQATMLAFLVTDATVDHATLQRALESAAKRTFNEHTVDGDTSTNDSVYALASGQCADAPSEEQLERALADVCEELAGLMVADGEGANHAVTVRVLGLKNDAEARKVARTVGDSPLVKTMIFGQDANWGRLMMAAGHAGVSFDPESARITVAGTEIVRHGLALGASTEVEAAKGMTAPRFEIELSLGDGPGSARVVTSDFGHGYVDVNAGYRS